ncbi:hypothetical protein BASA61_005868 [Batrachochytrium salamandrivorans]|nr:hypothetical protein BASA61_005868 [Batrachochytrium salamandrivorans]
MSPSPDTAVDTIVTSVEPVKKSTKAPKASVLALAASLAGGAVPSSIIDASATPSHGESKPNPDTTSTLPVDHISNLNVDSDGEDTSSVYSKSTSSFLPFLLLPLRMTWKNSFLKSVQCGRASLPNKRQQDCLVDVDMSTTLWLKMLKRH